MFLAVAMCVASPLLAQRTTVPFIGCKSDGQLGPQKAPTGKSKVVSIPTKSAQRLAYYEMGFGVGVLAPRGWYCFGTYGSGGEALHVSPELIDGMKLFSQEWRGFAGPAIEIDHSYGGTSGRFTVAETIAEVFPAHQASLRSLVEEEVLSASDFPTGPFPADSLIYISNEVVEYETPAQADGLGTQSNLRKGDRPISGVAILVGKTPDLLRLSVRLPADLSDLTSVIIQQVERDASTHR